MNYTSSPLESNLFGKEGRLLVSSRRQDRLGNIEEPCPSTRLWAGVGPTFQRLERAGAPCHACHERFVTHHSVVNWTGQVKPKEKGQNKLKGPSGDAEQENEPPALKNHLSHEEELIEVECDASRQRLHSGWKDNSALEQPSAKPRPA